MANEKRLIDANALKEHKVTGKIGSLSGDFVPGFVIDTAPTVDAVEVVHAHWEDGYSVDFKGGIVYTSIDCSHCNEIFKTDDREYWKARFKVCPFCGAIMDGGNENV